MNTGALLQQNTAMKHATVMSFTSKLSPLQCFPERILTLRHGIKA